MKLTLVRHGECTLSGTYCGHLDAPLTENGRQQAEGAAQRLASIPFEICYRSPLNRTHETARTICANRDIPIIDSPLLKEISFGLWEGKTHEEISKQWPELWNMWISSPMAASPPGGEALSSLRRRVKTFLSHLTEKYHKDVLIVSHGGVIAAMLVELQQKPISDFFQLVLPLGSFQTLEWVSDAWVIGASR